MQPALYAARDDSVGGVRPVQCGRGANAVGRAVRPAAARTSPRRRATRCAGIDRRNDSATPTRGFYSRSQPGLRRLRRHRALRQDAEWTAAGTTASATTAIFSVTGRRLSSAAGTATPSASATASSSGGDSFRGFQLAGIGPRDTTPGSATRWAASSTRSASRADVPQRPAGAIRHQDRRCSPTSARWACWTAPTSSSRSAMRHRSDRARRPRRFARRSGISVFWKSPLGPLRFDIAEPVVKRALRQDPDLPLLNLNKVLRTSSHEQTRPPLAAGLARRGRSSATGRPGADRAGSAASRSADPARPADHRPTASSPSTS